MDTSIILTPRHIQIVKDVDRFSRIKRYHGMLPKKDAGLYDEKVFETLLENRIIEEGTVFATCGSFFKGYRLAPTAKKDLKKLGYDVEQSRDKILPELDEEEVLDEEMLEVLQDVGNFCRIKKYCGIAPKHALEDYDKELLKELYGQGYIFQIKIKGPDVKYEKGYILSERGQNLLTRLGLNQPR